MNEYLTLYTHLFLYALGWGGAVILGIVLGNQESKE
jgi:hypothetical protein